MMLRTFTLRSCILILSLTFASPVFAWQWWDSQVAANKGFPTEYHAGDVNNPQPLTFMETLKQKYKAHQQKEKISSYEKKMLRLYENEQPETYEEYLEKSKAILPENRKLRDPEFEQDPLLTRVPDPHVRVVKYNNPPGSTEIDLTAIALKKQVNSKGVISPDMSTLVYSSVYYYPEKQQFSSEMFAIPIDKNLPVKDRLRKANIINKDKQPLLQTGMDFATFRMRNTLTLLDWSADSKKIAVKEKIGFKGDGIWQTNLWVYDFETNQAKNLVEVREAIKYYWLHKENLLLTDHRWDIHPLGWDALQPDRIIVLAMGYTGAQPRFLGAWSVDYKGNRVQLLSLSPIPFEVSANGLALKALW